MIFRISSRPPKSREWPRSQLAVVVTSFASRCSGVMFCHDLLQGLKSTSNTYPLLLLRFFFRTDRVTHGFGWWGVRAVAWKERTRSSVPGVTSLTSFTCRAPPLPEPHDQVLRLHWHSRGFANPDLPKHHLQHGEHLGWLLIAWTLPLYGSLHLGPVKRHKALR